MQVETGHRCAWCGPVLCQVDSIKDTVASNDCAASAHSLGKSGGFPVARVGAPDDCEPTRTKGLRGRRTVNAEGGRGRHAVAGPHSCRDASLIKWPKKCSAYH